MINRDDGQVIPNYSATNIENWLIRNSGELEMRDGITARGTSPSATNLGCAVLYRANGVKKIVRVINGAADASKFQASDDGVTWTDISGGTGRKTNTIWSLVQANNNLYGVNGVDTPIKYDGTSITTVAAIPNGVALEWWKNFLWVIGVAATPDRAYFSTVNDPETYGGSDFININLGDNSRGLGLRGTPGSTGRLYIGKQKSWWFITGSSSATFALNPLTYEFGCASQESIIQVKNDVWAVDLDGNIRRLYRTSFDTPFASLASRDVQATVSGLNRVAIFNGRPSAVYYNNYALFFIPNGVDDYNSLVLCWDTLANNNRGGWIKFTGWNIARAVVFQESATPKLFLFDSRTANGRAYEWTGTADNGIAITAKYETKIYDLGYPSQEKYFNFSYQYAPAVGDVNLRFFCSIDRYYYVKLADINLVGTGNKKLGQTWTLGVDKLGSSGFVKYQVPFSNYGGDTDGTTFQIKIEAESTTTKFRVRQFTSHYRLRGLL